MLVYTESIDVKAIHNNEVLKLKFIGEIIPVQDGLSI